jgi:hypothetical protein
MVWHETNSSRERAAKGGNMKLHEIANEYLTIMDDIVEAGGELTPDIESRLPVLMEKELPVKVDGYCKMIRTLETQAAVAMAEQDRIGKLISSRVKAAHRLKDWLRINLQRLGKDKVETGIFCVRIQKNGRPSITYDGNLDDLPFQFRRITVSLDGDAAYKRWKAGDELPEGFQITVGTQLRIT